jgi:hypothetical protein
MGNIKKCLRLILMCKSIIKENWKRKLVSNISIEFFKILILEFVSENGWKLSKV